MLKSKSSRGVDYENWEFFVRDALYEAFPPYKHHVVSKSSIESCTRVIAGTVARELRKQRGLRGLAIETRTPKHHVAKFVGDLVGGLVGRLVLLVLMILEELAKPSKRTKQKRATYRKRRARKHGLAALL